LVLGSPLYGKANEDACAHFQQFLELCSSFMVKEVAQDAIRLRLFPFFLQGRAKQSFYANRSAVNTWDKYTKAFIFKFLPTGKTNVLHARISSFQQVSNETIPKAWERHQEYILVSTHGMENWLIL